MVTVTTPEAVGMSADRLDAVGAAMQACVDAGKTAGVATLIARRGQVVQAGCYGSLDRATRQPLQLDSILRIYSLTKPITSVAALMLWEEGHFDLHDPITRWLPELQPRHVLQQTPTGDSELVPVDRDITIWHLLTHTAGLSYGFFGDTPAEALYQQAQLMSPVLTLQVPLADLPRALAALPLAGQPGSAFRYSLAHDVIGHLIEVISGMPLAEFLRTRILEPLGMQDTSFFVPPEKRDRFGPLYSGPTDERLPVLDPVAESPFVQRDAIASGGGGLVSTLPDYYRFAAMLARGGEGVSVRLLQPATMRAMWTNQLAPSMGPLQFGTGTWPGMGFGLGLGVYAGATAEGGMTPGTFGWIGASGCNAWIAPQEELVVIGMAQSLGYSEAVDPLPALAHAAILA